MRRGPGHVAVILDAARLAVGTLTVLPTRPPRSVDRRVAGWAMALAPVGGALLALLAGLWLWLLGWGPPGQPPLLHPLVGDRDNDMRVHPFLAAALVVGALALLTRAMHLDGLADTADGLGTGGPRTEALEVMRRGDVGPFGVVTLVLVLLVQVLALGVLIGEGRGLGALSLAVVLSRFTLPVLCSRRVPAARRDGLGHVVAGTVGPAQLIVAATLSVAVLAVLSALAYGFDGWSRGVLVEAGVVSVLALLAAAVVAWRAVRRLGGVTGDVLGAAVEVTFAAALVVLTVVA